MSFVTCLSFSLEPGAKRYGCIIMRERSRWVPSNGSAKAVDFVGRLTKKVTRSAIPRRNDVHLMSVKELRMGCGGEGTAEVALDGDVQMRVAKAKTSFKLERRLP